MHWLASIRNALHGHRQRTIALIVGLVLTASGSALTTIDDTQPHASVHRVDGNTLVLTAAKSDRPVEQIRVAVSSRSPVTSQPKKDAPWGSPPPVEPTPVPGVPTRIEPGSTELSRGNQNYRERFNISSGRNVAVFLYRDRDGILKTLRVSSVDKTAEHGHTATFEYEIQEGPHKGERWAPPTVPFEKAKGTHSEKLIADRLENEGIKPEKVYAIHSDREFCVLPGYNCKALVISKYQQAALTYHLPKEVSSSNAKKAIDGWLISGEPLRLFEVDEHKVRESRKTAMENALLHPGASPGGIDFSSLELRYMADPGPGANQGLKYAFTASPAIKDNRTDIGLSVAQQASDAFFVWLDLPTSKFWVNLNPSEPGRIADSQLGRTDTGRVLLEADLQMKRTVAKLIHPDTPLGAQFWHSLDRVGSATCLSFRQWIVPGPATIREDNGELYILDAPLSVQLESEYIQSRSNSNYQTSCPGHQESVDQYNETVFRTLILPQVQRAVDEAPEYAELRRVYLSRVAAEWYRQRSARGSTTFAGLIDSGDITRWVSRRPWSPQDVFHRYVESYTNGEFNVRRDTRQGNIIETRTYVYGGVDFTDIPFHKLTAGDFQSKWPDLSNTVKQAFDHPTTDQKRKIWLGSTSTVSSSRQGSGGHFTIYLLFLAVIGVAAGAMWACSWWQVRLAPQQANPSVRPQATQSRAKPQPTQTRSFGPSNLGLKASAVQAEYRKYHKRNLAQGSQTLSSRKPPAPNQYQHRRDDL